jgi:membrane associated rhomboid family serine protease
VSANVRSRFAGFRITPGALIIAGLELGLSLTWLLADSETRTTMLTWLMATPSAVFEHGRVWTLVTGMFLETSAIALILHMLVLWSFVPTLERFWGTARFYRFVAITGVVGTLAGCALAALGLPRAIAVSGLDPMIYAALVAFGILYARQPVQFFGVLPLTGRQLMYGFIAFLALSIAFSRDLVSGGAYAAAMLAAAILVSKRWSPALAWKKWRIARARSRLRVMAGGQGHVPPVRDEHKWLN